jgi:hypothetical protein
MRAGVLSAHLEKVAGRLAEAYLADTKQEAEKIVYGTHLECLSEVYLRSLGCWIASEEEIVV